MKTANTETLMQLLSIELLKNNTTEIVWRLQHDSPQMAAATAAAQIQHLTRWIAIVNAANDTPYEIKRIAERAKGPLAEPIPQA